VVTVVEQRLLDKANKEHEYLMAIAQMHLDSEKDLEGKKASKQNYDTELLRFYYLGWAVIATAQNMAGLA